MEPVHLLTALLNQDDGGARSLLQRAGAIPVGWQRHSKVPSSACQVLGAGGEVQAGRELMAVLNLTASMQCLKPSGLSWRMGTK